MFRKIHALATTILVLGIATPAAAIEAERRIEVAAAPADVWAMIGPFCAIQEWHPSIISCTEEAEQDGTVLRRLALAGGGEIVEQQVSRDDEARQYSYRIVESPLPVRAYKSTLTVDSVDGGARIVWKSTFEPHEAPEADAKAAIDQIYADGLHNIQQMIED